MSITSFVSSITDRLFKNDIQSDMDMSIQEIETSLIPYLSELKFVLNNKEFKDKKNQDLVKTFYSNYKTNLIKGDKLKLTKNFYNDLLINIVNVNSNLKLTRVAMDKKYNTDIIPTSTNYSGAVTLRSASHMTYLVRFTTDLLNVMISREILIAGKFDDVKYNESMSPSRVVIKNIESNTWVYSKLISIYGTSPDSFASYVNNAPDMYISNMADDMFKDNIEDPVSQVTPQGFIGNPIYNIRMVFTTWEAERYKALKDKKKLLEVKLLYLKGLNESESNIELEKEITYLQDRVSDIDFKLAKMESS